MTQRYKQIISKVKESQLTGDSKGLKRWKNKLEKWRLEYGAHSPITSNNYQRQE